MRRARRTIASSTMTDRIFVGLAAAVLVGVGVVYAVTNDPEPTSSAGPRWRPSETPAVDRDDTPITKVKLASAMKKLQDPERRFTVALIGDSTGVDTAGWQMKVMDWLSVESGRPWEMRQWHQDEAYGPPGYFPDPWKYGSGTRAPITLWNASAGGKSFEYTAGYLDKMFPKNLKSVDLLLVNHGHNVDPPHQYYYTGVPVMEKLLKRYPEAAMLVMAQNPEKGNPTNITALETVLRYVYTLGERRSAEIVDVHRAFEKTGNPEKLIDETLFHPSPKGYELWADVVVEHLERAMPA